MLKERGELGKWSQGGFPSKRSQAQGGHQNGLVPMIRVEGAEEESQLGDRRIESALCH